MAKYQVGVFKFVEVEAADEEEAQSVALEVVEAAHPGEEWDASGAELIDDELAEVVRLDDYRK